MTKDEEIKRNMEKLGLTQAEAEELYACDHGFDSNDEQEALDEQAKGAKTGTGVEKEKKTRKPREIKVSDEKKEIFQNIHGSLIDNYNNVRIITENKLIQVQIGTKLFDINIIEKRPPKK
jgi:hypothetical protein